MKAISLIPELGCTNFQKSLDFYTNVLNFEVLYQRAEEGFAMLEREGARLMIDLISVGRSWASGHMEYPFGRGMNLQIEVSDVDELYNHIKKNDHPIYLELEEKWYRANDKSLGNKQFIIQDPDGYLLRFFEDLGARANS